jgi:hypothetical protein
VADILGVACHRGFGWVLQDGYLGWLYMGACDGRRFGLTAGQLGIWHALQFVPGSSVFNIGQCLRIDGDLDTGLFGAALRLAMGEAGAGRIRVHEDGEVPRQCVADFGEWPFHLAEVSSEAAACEWMQADMGRPVDLRTGPVGAFALFKVAPGRFLWYLRAHHIAVDGLGAWMFVRRVAAIYTALATGARPGDGAPEPYPVLLAAEAQYRESAGLAEDREFWAGALAGFGGAVSLGRRPGHRGAQVPVRSRQDLDAAEAAAAQTAARRLGARPGWGWTAPSMSGTSPPCWAR